MQVANISGTHTTISAQQACDLNGAEKFSCPSCGVELFLCSMMSRSQLPFFRSAINNPHHPECEFNTHVGGSLRGMEFESFLVDVLKEHSSYSHVEQDSLLGRDTRYRIDILASRKFGKSSENIIIECKVVPPNSYGQLKRLLGVFAKYREVNKISKLVLAIPATLSEQALKALKAERIEVWDLDFLSKEFIDVVERVPESFFKAVIKDHAARAGVPTIEENFISSIKSCAPGKRDCYVYQKLVGEILAHLFSPPLIAPISELSDNSKSNRRDFIMPNYADTGFWAFLRARYSADYVIVDAKNYTKKVGKKDVLQIANYLKSHGAGLFGLIFSRNGGDSSGCEFTLREQWLINKKMIVIFDDDDVISMLLAKSDGRLPEQILGNKIEQFRLSM